MLRMCCSNCQAVVNSLFLADLSTVECGECKENIPVKDVFITTRHFTVNREEFINRTFRFQRLLKDVEKDLGLLMKDNSASKKSIENLEQFRSSLQELLDGTRDSYRMEIPRDLYVEVNALSRIFRGKLLNLSSEGCSIEFVMAATIPREKSEINIEFFFPGLSEILSTYAKVIWTKKQIREDGSYTAIIGVTFIDMSKNTRSCIWDYIINNTPVPYQRVATGLETL